jgi:tRNA(fMet)-specific endonuclease VapC
MSGRCLLDTNVVIALFAGEPAIVGYLKGAEEVFVPSIVIGELYYGARKSSRVADNVARIDDFAASNVILSCDTETAY